MQITINGQGRLFLFDQPLTDEDVLSVFQQNPDMWFSRSQVAGRLGVSKSPALIARLETLTAGGILERSFVSRPNRVDMFVYALAAPPARVEEENGSLID